MSSPFIGEIKMFTASFAPRGYAFCNGQSLQIAQNTALYALVGAVFGGDGKTYFNLPDLRGRTPLHRGQSSGLSNYQFGTQNGVASVALTTAQMAVHTHLPQADSTPGTNRVPTPQTGAIWSSVPRGAAAPYAATGASVALNSASVAAAGAATVSAHNNISPHQVVGFIIALSGLFPMRS